MSSPLLAKTVGSFVVERPARSKVFETFGIDYCCGGHKPLGEACAEGGHTADAVLEALARFDAAAPAEEAPIWNGDLAALADHIESTHHAYLHEELPRLSMLVDRVANAHGGSDPRLLQLRMVWERFRGEMELHMAKEEQILFPLCRRLAAGAPAGSFHCGSVRGPVAVMRAEHDDHAVNLGLIKDLTDHFAVPDFACNTYRAMLDALKELEQDLHRHIHKENFILFPAAEAVEAGVPVPAF